jgi:hypothetical protein
MSDVTIAVLGMRAVGIIACVSWTIANPTDRPAERVEYKLLAVVEPPKRKNDEPIETRSTDTSHETYIC